MDIWTHLQMGSCDGMIFWREAHEQWCVVGVVAGSTVVLSMLTIWGDNVVDIISKYDDDTKIGDIVEEGYEVYNMI